MPPKQDPALPHLNAPASSRFLRRKRGSFTGVCGGLARYFKVNPFWLRLAFVITTPFTSGFSLLAYAGLAFWLPKDPPEQTGTYAIRVHQTQVKLPPGADWQQKGVIAPSEEARSVCDHCDTVSRPYARYCHRCGSPLEA